MLDVCTITHAGLHPIQAIRGEAEVTSQGTLKPKEYTPGHFKSTERPCHSHKENAGQTSENKVGKKSEQPSQARSLFQFKQPKAAMPQHPQDPGYKHSGGETTPEYSIVHQGTHDLADAWSDHKVCTRAAAALQRNALVLKGSAGSPRQCYASTYEHSPCAA
jgi:hypothetical protein